MVRNSSVSGAVVRRYRLPLTALAMAMASHAAFATCNPATTQFPFVCDASGNLAIGDTVIAGPAYLPAPYTNTIAMGTNAAAKSDSSIAIGGNALAASTDYTTPAVAIGSNSSANNATVAVGSNATGGGNSVAIGYNATNFVLGQAAANSVAVGSGATSSMNSVAIGYNALMTTGTYSSTLLGANAYTSSPNATVIGMNARAQGGGVVMGNNSTLYVGGEAIGYNAVNYSPSGIALGDNSQAGLNGSSSANIAIGSAAKALNSASIAIGAGTNTGQGVAVTLIGDHAATTNSAQSISSAVALGSNAITTNGGTAIGALAQLVNGANNATAIGELSYVTGLQGVAIGGGAQATNSNATAIGYGANASSNYSIALGAYSTTGNPDSVAGATIDGTAYTFAGKISSGVASVGSVGSERNVTNVAAGLLSGTSTDAVNGSQLYATNQAVNALGQVAVRYDDASQSKVTLGGVSAAAPVALTNIAVGALTATSTDAVNGSQLNATNVNVTNNSTAIGALQQDSLQWNSSLGAYDASHGTGTAQSITNVASGQLSATSTDAVNGSQLNATNQVVSTNRAALDALGYAGASAMGGSTVYNPATGALAGTSFGLTNANAINGTTGAAGNVTDGFSKVDGALGGLSNAITDITTNINNGSIGLVKQDSTSRNINVGADTDGSVVDVTGTAGKRKVTGVSDGDLDASSSDAVNGSQLYTTNQQVASNTNAIGVLNSNVSTLQMDALQWNASLGAYDASHGTGTAQKITNVAAGVNPTDAVNVSQLSATTTAATANAVQYDDATHSKVTLGGAGSAPVAMTNVASGAVTSTSTDAVNGSQLYATNQQVASNTTAITNLNNQVSTISGNVTTLQQDSLQWNASAGAYDASHGTGTAQKISNVAAGVNATDAVNVSQLNQVAGVAANAVQYDDASKTSVTMGGTDATAPVAVHNVATGTAGNDAVNVNQLTSATTTAVQAANSYTDASSSNAVNIANKYTDQAIAGLNDQFNSINRRVDNLSRTQQSQCAMSQASIGAIAAGAGGNSTRIVAGTGLCSGGASGLAVGVSAPIGDRWHVAFNASTSRGQGAVNAGVGFDIN